MTTLLSPSQVLDEVAAALPRTAGKTSSSSVAWLLAITSLPEIRSGRSAPKTCSVAPEAFGRFCSIRVVIFLIAGKLDFSAINRKRSINRPLAHDAGVDVLEIQVGAGSGPDADVPGQQCLVVVSGLSQG